MSHEPAIEGVYFTSRPETYRALQRAVHAAAQAHAQLGKKGLFGGDQHAAAFEKFKVALHDLCRAIDTDGDMIAVHIDDSWARFQEHRDHLCYIDSQIQVFRRLFPNWPDAYQYWEEFYRRATAQGIKRY